VPWPSDLDEAWRPLAVKARIAVRDMPDDHVEVLDVDCDEFPCILYLLQRNRGVTSSVEAREWLAPSDPGRSLALFEIERIEEGNLQVKALTLFPDTPALDTEGVSTRFRYRARMGFDSMLKEIRP